MKFRDTYQFNLLALKLYGTFHAILQNIVRVEECKVYLENPQDSKAPEKSFIFDNAYDASSNNETIYSEICYSLVEVSRNSLGDAGNLYFRKNHLASQIKNVPASPHHVLM